MMRHLICNGCGDSIPATQDLPHTQRCDWHSHHPEWKPCRHDGVCFRETEAAA